MKLTDLKLTNRWHQSRTIRELWEYARWVAGFEHYPGSRWSMWQYTLPNFIQAVWWFFTEEPQDCSSLYPYG